MVKGLVYLMIVKCCCDCNCLGLDGRRELFGSKMRGRCVEKKEEVKDHLGNLNTL